MYEKVGIEDNPSEWNIVRAYIEGKLIIADKDGEKILKINKDYVEMRSIIKAIKGDIKETLRKAQLMNLLNYRDMNLVTEGYIGGMIAASGVLRLDTNNWLSIKAVIDKERNRMKCVYVEKVDFEGNREELTYKELLELLQNYGYNVKSQKERSASERDEILKRLKENIIYSPRVPYVRGIGVSNVGPEYVPLKITYDKNSADSDSMWITSATTVDDINTIKTVGGILTTGGGMLDHANIIARENGTTSILSNGVWENGKLVLTYYSAEGKPVSKNGFNTQKMVEHKLVLEEGDVVLANGITGRLLVFKNLPEIETLQNAIYEKNIKEIERIITDNIDSEKIEEIIEYIFFQTISDKDKREIISLLESFKDRKIGTMVTALFDKHLNMQYDIASMMIDNVKAMLDENIKYVILSKAKKIISSININGNSNSKFKKIEQEFDDIYKQLNENIVKSIENLKEEIGNILRTGEVLSVGDRNRLTKISLQLKVLNYYGDKKLKDLVTETDRLLQIQQQGNSLSYEDEIKNFSGIQASELSVYGSKTTEEANISGVVNATNNQMMQVPNGYGVSKNAVGVFFANAGKFEEYSDLEQKLELAIQKKDVEEAVRLGKEMSALIDKTNDMKLKKYLENILENKKYAIRSSGVGEDGGDYAFAGMAETKLNQDKDSVYSSIKECWQSFYTEDCIKDMIKQGVMVKPALLVQEMVENVEKAGVIFTRDDRGNLIIEVVRGLGEGLVSGRIDPDHITVRANDQSIEYIRDTNCKLKVVAQENGGTGIQKLTAEEKIDRILSGEQIEDLFKIASLLEEDAGYPVDIEFAIDKAGKIFILQRRPITTFYSNNVFANDPIKKGFENIFSKIDNANVTEDQKDKLKKQLKEIEKSIYEKESAYSVEKKMENFLEEIDSLDNASTILNEFLNLYLSLCKNGFFSKNNDSFPMREVEKIIRSNIDETQSIDDNTYLNISIILKIFSEINSDFIHDLYVPKVIDLISLLYNRYGNSINDNMNSWINDFVILYSQNSYRNKENLMRLYKRIGISKDTITFLANAARKQNLKIYFPNIFVHIKPDATNIQEISDIIIKNRDYFNIVNICIDLFNSKGVYREICINICNWMLDTLISDQKDNNLYNNIFVNIINSEIFNELDKTKIDLIIDKYDEGVRYERIDDYFYYIPSRYMKEAYRIYPYRITSLIARTNFRDKDFCFSIPPIKYSTKEIKNAQKAEEVRSVFKNFRDLLQNNIIALELLNTAKDVDDLEEVMKHVQIMINDFKEINSELANDAQTALNNIRKILEQKQAKVSFHKKIQPWTQKNIENITTLNSLINAIHQTAIATFREKLSDNIEENQNSLVLSHNNNNTSIGVYDISEKRIHKDILKFLEELSMEKLPRSPYDSSDSKQQLKDLVCMDDLLVWTPRLGYHSVDIITNFNELNREITISFNESSRSLGNKYRIIYFKKVLEKLGFKVSGEEFNLKAILNSENGLNENIDMVNVLKHVMVLFKYSSMLDFDLGEYRGYSDIENNVIKKLVDKFFSDSIWYGYSPNSMQGWGEYLFEVPGKPRINVEEIQKIFSELGLEETVPDKITNQEDVDKYINKPLERAYAVGRIILDERGYLIKNTEYNITKYLAQNILDDRADAVHKAMLINLLPRKEFKFKPVGYVGGLLAVSGYLKLKNSSYLSVKGLVDPKNNTIYYCVVELVTKNSRYELDMDSMKDILENEGYDIQVHGSVSESEQKNIDNKLNSTIQFIDTPNIYGQGTSESDGLYVYGFITTDKNNVDENSIYVAPYTTPDDIGIIQKVKGLITMIGGVLSHAAITTREYKKPSMILSGVSWEDKNVEVTYYAPEKKSAIFRNLQIRNADKKQIMLKDKTRVLLNGDTGHLLLFIDVDDNILDQIQIAIDDDNDVLIRQLFMENQNNKDIDKIVEYVYFQVVGNIKKNKTMDMLFSSDMPTNIKEKIKDLNKGYIQNKISKISEAIESLESMSNPNEKYRLLERMKEKLERIKTADDIKELTEQKNIISSMEGKIKQELYNYISNLIKESNEYINSTDLDNVKINRIISIIRQASVYDMFVLDNESVQSLRDIKDQVVVVVEELKNVLQKYVSENNKKGKHVSSFSDIDAIDVNLFGSKTVEIARMTKLLEQFDNVVVPNGMGISTLQFEDFIGVRGKDLLSDLEKAVKNNDFIKAQELRQDIIAEIERRKKDAKVKENMNEVINYISDKLNNVRCFVRTSGVGEDSVKYAFAGMGETIPNVDKDSLYDAIIECWESFYGQRSVEYMVQSGQVVKPAILVQEAIDVEIAGVLFTSNNYGKAIIESLYGEGEGLVSGKLTPDTITIDLGKGVVLEYCVATKQYQYILTTDGTQRVLSDRPPNARALSNEEISNLIKVAAKLEQEDGYPLDIEFGIKDGKIYILQKRPITTNDVEIQETNADTKINIMLEFGNVTDTEKLYEFVNIQNPLNEEEAITVYLKFVGGNVVFVMDEKYKNLESEIIKRLKERIKDDPIVMHRLKEHLRLTERSKADEFDILPIGSDNILDIEGVVNIVDTADIRNMLASA